MSEKQKRDTVGKIELKRQKWGSVKFLNFLSVFGKVDKLDDCISFCCNYNLLPVAMS